MIPSTWESWIRSLVTNTLALSNSSFFPISSSCRAVSQASSTARWMFGHRNDRNMAAFRFFALADCLDSGKCIQLWRFHIHENQIKTQGARLGQGLLAIAGDDYLLI